MTRRITVEDVIKTATSTEQIDVSFLHNELRQAEPNEMALRAIFDHHPYLIIIANDSGSYASHIVCSNINTVSIDVLVLVHKQDPAGFQRLNNFQLLPVHKAVCAPGFPNINLIAMVIKYYPLGLTIGNKEGQLPLHLALSVPKAPSVELIRLLLDCYPDSIKQSDKYGHYPLHKACAKGGVDLEVVEMLLKECPEAASISDKKGFLPLHWAVSRDQPNLAVIYALCEVYPEGVFDRDDGGNLPYDKLIQRKVRDAEVEEALLDITELAHHQKVTAENLQNRMTVANVQKLSRGESRRKFSTRSLLSGR